MNTDGRRWAAIHRRPSVFICVLLSLTLASSQAAAIDESKLIDLTYPFDEHTIYWPTEKPFQLEKLFYGEAAGGYFYSANKFCAPEHGGTHMDAPIHFAEGKLTADQVPLSSLIGTAAVVDVSAKAAADPDYRLAVADLQAWEEKHGRIPDGAIVVMNSGWGKYWGDKKHYLGTDVFGDVANLHFPGFSREAAEWLVRERSIDAIAVDREHRPRAVEGLPRAPDHQRRQQGRLRERRRRRAPTARRRHPDRAADEDRRRQRRAGTHRRRASLIPLLILLLAVAGCRGEGGAPLLGPRMVVEQDSHDAGAIDAGAALSHTFRFRNDGGRPLRLAALRAGCGCRADSGPAEVVAPGQAGTIDVACDTADSAGRLRRTVTVYTNDASHPQVTLALQAEVRADVAAPPEFYFGRAARGERTARDIRLSVSDAASAPRQARSESGLLDARLEKRPADDWRVALTVAPRAPAGTVRDRVIVETGSSDHPRLVVPVVGTVVESPEGGEGRAVR